MTALLAKISLRSFGIRFFLWSLFGVVYLYGLSVATLWLYDQHVHWRLVDSLYFGKWTGVTLVGLVVGVGYLSIAGFLRHKRAQTPKN